MECLDLTESDTQKKPSYILLSSWLANNYWNCER